MLSITVLINTAPQKGVAGRAGLADRQKRSFLQITARCFNDRADNQNGQAPMTRTEMLEIMTRLDTRANGLLLTGASDIDLLAGMFDLMPDFKALLDSPYRGEIEANATRFPGLYRYGVMLTEVAEGIADGSIRVPR
jgi:hypothetical protein